jgi:hypothetical protein
LKKIFQNSAFKSEAFRYTLKKYFTYPKNMSSCSCIIPFYNEENRIISVLRELLKVEEFDEFILVND